MTYQSVRRWISAVGFMTMCTTGVRADFLPPNNLDLQDDINFTGGVTQDEFNAILDSIETIYAPIIKAHGATLKIHRNWDDATVNASANQWWGTWHLNMYGGLARRPEVTADGFAMVVCHELGHHLGGFPFTGWAGNEGQSDYFAALSCARILWGHETEKNALAREAISAFPRELCDANFEGQERRDLGYRQMLAGESIAGLLAALKGSQISYTTPDTSVVDKTFNSHPEAQCRLDTYIASTLCKAEWDINVIPKDERISSKYTCTIAGGDNVGMRPKCWFKEGI